MYPASCPMTPGIGTTHHPAPVTMKRLSGRKWMDACAHETGLVPSPVIGDLMNVKQIDFELRYIQLLQLETVFFSF